MRAILREHREAKDLSVSEMARLLKMESSAYQDLEDYDDEWMTTISLGQAALALKHLGIDLRKVYGNSNAISLEMLRDALERHLKSSGQDVLAFGQQIGWDLGNALDDATA